MDNPCHRDRIANLKRIEGQIRGIIAMIEDERYCIDILDQLKAVKNSISSVEHNILGFDSNFGSHYYTRHVNES